MITTPPEPRRDIERQRVIKNGNFEREFEWNKIEIIAINDKAAHLVNGRIINTLFDMRVQQNDNRNTFVPLTSGRIALEIEAGPPIAQKVGKLLAMRTAHMDFDSAMQWSETAIPLVGLSADAREGAAAFREKRESDFKGV